MPQVDVLPFPTESADLDLAAWLQLELELDPAPIVQLAQAEVFPGKPAQHCPLCRGDLVAVAGGMRCACCGVEIDL